MLLLLSIWLFPFALAIIFLRKNPNDIKPGNAGPVVI